MKHQIILVCSSSENYKDKFLWAGPISYWPQQPPWIAIYLQRVIDRRQLIQKDLCVPESMRKCRLFRLSYHVELEICLAVGPIKAQYLCPWSVGRHVLVMILIRTFFKVNHYFILYLTKQCLIPFLDIEKGTTDHLYLTRRIKQILEAIRWFQVPETLNPHQGEPGIAHHVAIWSSRKQLLCNPPPTKPYQRHRACQYGIKRKFTKSYSNITHQPFPLLLG